ncbi:5-methyltetrahydrofolate--homocysteine methyltransferase [Tangfeifania diversioriginum]|uniref:5-methyltetrahydrofolate--homocysteine methyltransferase n=1 Tax=Tangfeifania diversioriginum TaxID=1168035 RepID=A0A1M6KIE4_9BACT|nr:homocysteine S-methyltransferase family protein [Tangfeifania diversioriginum]SHJ58681.1 5-methyltetrahydrofolate--homocysteine methyltransferase [Tangfeifania diversioriginum]
MGKILNKIKQGKVLVSDGAWGTFLQQKGLKPGECPEEWNISHPDEVFDIAQNYIHAGSDMIETNSFGASRFKLEKYNLAEKTFDLNKAAAEISKRAAGEKFVLGSIGPTGVILMMGEVTEQELYEAFKEQALGLEAGGADAIMIETMTDLDEARIAVKAAKENTSLEVFCTMTFEKTVTGEFRSMMGVSPTEMVETIIDAGAVLIGANCGNGIAGMVGIVEEIRKANTEIPILVHANAGMPVYQDGETVFPETPDEMAALVPEIIAAGANVVGGCCGTTPEHISRVRKIIDEK